MAADHLHESVMAATVVITSKNRRDDLDGALASCMRQRSVPEVVVVDDGSDDGTAEMVTAKYPSVILVRNQVSTGYIAARNRAAEMATGDVIVSIDDDAVFTTPNVVARTMTDFDDDRIGAVAIPFIDVNKSPAEHQRSPDPSQTFVTDRFIGTAHAVRRNLFLRLGGYRESFFHQGEEGDFCLRMMNKGYFVKLGNADPIHHFESPKRDTRRMDLYGRRNEILSAWLNVPLSRLPIHLTGVTIKGIRFGFMVGRPLVMIRGTLLGLGAIVRFFSDRDPVSLSAYRLVRRLRTVGPMKLQELDAMNDRPQ